MKINPKPSESVKPPCDSKGGMGLDSPAQGGGSKTGNGK